MLFLLRTQTSLVRDTVLEGVPTQDMLVSMEREPLDETDVITSFSTEQTLCYVRSLKILARKLADMNPHFLLSLIWCIVVGDQVSAPLHSHPPASR